MLHLPTAIVFEMSMVCVIFSKHGTAVASVLGIYYNNDENNITTVFFIVHVNMTL